VRNVIGEIYLLHFDRPYRHARHYTGWAKDTNRRVGQHLDGSTHSNPLILAAQSAGIGVSVARVWKRKTRNDERRLKNQGGASRRCPLCQMEKLAKKGGAR
jgi:hypothetical protein